MEIWSDLACPWCAIGKRRFETALDAFPHREQVTVRWRSFELDPNAPPVRDGSLTDNLAAKYGVSREQAQAMQRNVTETAAADGLEFRFDIARGGNTFDAHRLLHLAADHGVQPEVQDRLFRAYFREGEPIGDPDALARVLADTTLDNAEVRAILDGDTYADAVRADQALAGRLGISAVPFFVLDDRYAVSGAQPAAVFAEALTTAWSAAHPLVPVAGTTTQAACTDGSCPT